MVNFWTAVIDLGDVILSAGTDIDHDDEVNPDIHYHNYFSIARKADLNILRQEKVLTLDWFSDLERGTLLTDFKLMRSW